MARDALGDWNFNSSRTKGGAVGGLGLEDTGGCGEEPSMGAGMSDFTMIVIFDAKMAT
jgi:hypothetical protein